MFNVSDAPTNLHVVITTLPYTTLQKMIMTSLGITIMLGVYLVGLILWDRINARLELKRALKEYKKNFGC